MVKDVDNHFEIIEDDPLARWKTVNRRGAQAVVFFQSRLNFIGDRLELRLRSGRTNDKEIGEAGDAGKIENDDFFGLFVRGELGAGRG